METPTRLGMAVSAAVLALTPSAWAAINNGFDTDKVYALRETGELRTFNKADGSSPADLTGNGIAPAYGTLTFANRGANDARLYVAKVVGDDIQIMELNSSGAVVNSVSLGSLSGVGAMTAPILGDIRYSRVSNSLVVGVYPSNAAGANAVAYEVNLGLTQRLHTYQGPVLPSTDLRNVNVAINERDGTVYMTSRHLGETTVTSGPPSRGDLISFTAGAPDGTTTSTFSTLIDGDTYFGVTGDTRWDSMQTVIYRQRPGGGIDDTVLLPNNNSSSARALLQFFLDSGAHPSGNAAYLALMDSPGNIPRGWNGQQDLNNGDVWVAALRGNLWKLTASGTFGAVAVGGNWLDVAVPAPEPATIGLLLVSMLALARRRFRANG